MRFAGVLLAGGKSRRMGVDKAFLELGGEEMWRRGVRVLEDAGAERVLVSVNSGQVGRMGGEAEILVDPPGVADPLSALVLGMEAAGGLPVVLLAVDMPGMTAGFLWSRLLSGVGEGKGRYFVTEEGRVEPFGALYPAGLLEVARRRVGEGEFSLTGCLKEGQSAGLVEAVRLGGGEENFFANVNTPANLREIGHGE